MEYICILIMIVAIIAPVYNYYKPHIDIMDNGIYLWYNKYVGGIYPGGEVDKDYVTRKRIKLFQYGKGDN